ncbi:MAG: phage/plasmid primase, P4 family [Promethearchaeota archaeon]
MEIGSKEWQDKLREINEKRKEDEKKSKEMEIPIERHIANIILNSSRAKCFIETGEMLFFNGRKWTKGKEAENRILKIINDAYKGVYHKKNPSRYSISTIFTILQSESFIGIEEFEHKGFLINCKNGIYNTRTKIFKEHPISSRIVSNDYDGIFWIINANYDPNAKCPKIDKFIEDIFGKEKKELVYEVIGLALLPTTKFQKAIMLYGSGANGKSTFLELIIDFVGRKNVCQVSLHALQQSQFELLNFKGKLTNIVPDLQDRELYDTGNFKIITTDKYISGRKKHIQDPIEFENICTQFFSCNQLPEVKTYDFAFWRRWILLPCLHVFTKDDKDPDILKKIKSEEEFSGLLNKAIEGINRIYDNNGFSEEYTEEVERVWKEESKPLGNFIKTFCLTGEDFQIEQKEFVEMVNNYREKNRLTQLSLKAITIALKQHGIFLKRTNQGRFYIGIKLREKDVSYIDQY